MEIGPMAAACRDCALGLLRTARIYKEIGCPDDVARLVQNARWYWHSYLTKIREI